MQEKYININKLKVSESLSRFVKDELLKDTNISSDDFWLGFERTVEELEPKNRQLINFRETLQKKIDAWHIKNKSNEFNLIEYKKFLVEIGYLKEEGPDFSIDTKNVDDEITKIAGPQLVVPIMNSRYALNAANARWMSLYDSLYGTDVIEQSEDSVSERYDPLRGEMVIKYGRDFLDKYFPLKDMSWSKITTVAVKEGSFKALKGVETFDLVDEEKFIGHRGEADNPSAIILKNNNLHIEILRDRRAFSAQQDYAGISDIILESAISTICDNEDSVAAVDAADKVICYRNWLGFNERYSKNSI
jgi:malate synthase